MRRLFLPLLTLLLVFQQLTSIAQQPWKPVPGTLTTPWTDKVSPENALPEYPRPSMTRVDWLNLNGLWHLNLLDEATGKPVKQGQILVPYPVESALSGLGWKVMPNNVLVYAKKVFIPSRWKGQRVLLHFGAVDWQASVFVNSKKTGDHKGGYDAFSFDITDQLTFGAEAEITVHVTDPTDTGGQAIGKQRLSPGGIWYTPTSGIWQTVWLEPVPATYIRSYRVEPYVEKNNRVLVRVETEGNMDGLRIAARIWQDGKVITQSTGKPGTPLLLTLTDGRLWTLDDPFLYDLEITIEGGHTKFTDKVKGYFGLRKISVEPDDKGVPRLMLNGKPVFQLGPLDQGFWPDGLYTPPTEEAMHNDIVTMKSLGFNMLRKHVKVEPERWYHLCDKLGMLVWQDMPSAGNNTEADKQQFQREMKAMVDGLFNHPAIIMWVPFNEGWGQHDTDFYVEKLREWDPTRLVNNASGWTDMGVGDVLDIHEYPGPAAPVTEGARAGVLGEFGGLGLNVAGHLWTNQGWGYQLIETPEALLERYEDLYRQLLPLIDSAGLSAAVYTQVSDVETESNGLMTYDRKILKMDAGLVALAHKGQMPPKPANQSRIFYKKTTVPLTCVKPGAGIEYAIDNGKPEPVWLPYTAPIALKKTTALLCKATWPGGAQSHTQRYTFTKTKPVKGKGGKASRPGLAVKMYEGSWDKLPDFNTLSPSKELTTNELSLQGIDRQENFGLVFEGALEVPATGVYTFHVRSDDGSRLTISGQRLIEHDGLHGLTEKTGSIVLKKGKHLVRFEFFQKLGGVGLECWWEDEFGKKLEMRFVH
ncbi:MAG: chitobiase/beta-hexosaminidase C-terminal domain-containing protein [Bacteroidetes bacterium]|nr:chitobiase/beta-hexosaminidase C-terminal domain-containing protein [Bacteroidota bacterium]